MSAAIQVLSTVFTLAVPDHRCALPDVTNDTWLVQNRHHATLINLSVPSSPSSALHPCHLYRPPIPPPLASDLRLVSAEDGIDPQSTGNRSSASVGSEGDEVVEEEGRGEGGRGMVTCDSYVYDTSTYTSTITADLDLVCERSLHRSHALMMIMMGNLLGAQVVGFFSDILGRKPVMMLSIVLHLVGALTLTFTYSLSMLMALLFSIGASVPGILIPTFVMCMELVGPSKRKWTGYGQMALWSVGTMLLAAMAFLLRNWQHLQLISAILILPLLSYYWLIPESPRWLISRGRLPEAEAILYKTAHVNGVSLPADMLSRVRVEKQRGVSLLRACVSPALIVRLAIVCFAWMVNSLTYYGLNWNVGQLQGNVYLNFLLLGVMELLSYACCLLLLDHVGRRPLNCGLMLLAGLTCTAILLPVLYAPDSARWLTVMLAMMGKLGISGSFATIFIFSSELFPTVLRNSAMGTCSMCARIGGVIAPYIATLGDLLTGKAATVVPMVTYGVLCMVAGLLLLLLPETANVALPQTVEDSVRLARKRDTAGERNNGSAEKRHVKEASLATLQPTV